MPNLYFKQLEGIKVIIECKNQARQVKYSDRSIPFKLLKALAEKVRN